MKRIKLKDPTGMFVDPQSGQRVLKGEVVDLIEPVGRATQDWLNAGGLLLVEPKLNEPAPPPLPAEDESAATGDSILLDPDAAPSSPPPPKEPEEKKPPVKRNLSGMLKKKPTTTAKK